MPDTSSNATEKLPFRFWAQGKEAGMAEAVRVHLGLKRSQIDDDFEVAALDKALDELLNGTPEPPKPESDSGTTTTATVAPPKVAAPPTTTTTLTPAAPPDGSALTGGSSHDDVGGEKP